MKKQKIWICYAIIIISSLLIGYPVYATDGTPQEENANEIIAIMEEAGVPVLNASESMEINVRATCPVSASATKYDPRNYNRITSVKNQGRYGLCWDFTTQACIEQYLINTGKATNSIDLSEAYLAYHIWKNYRYMLSTWSGFLDDAGYSIYGYKWNINDGDYLPIALESDFKYENLEQMESLTEEQLENYKYKIRKCYYLDDYSIDEVNTVKSMIVNYGAVAASYYSSEEYGLSSSYYNNVYYGSTEDYCCYAPTSAETNHAITIVGWDDNYSKDNFYYAPEGDGAWLCKNSWGTGGYAGSGYFWLSYYNQDNEGDTYAAIVVVDKSVSTNKIYKSYQVVYGEVLDLSVDYPDCSLDRCIDKEKCFVLTDEGLQANKYGTTEINVYDADGFKLGVAEVEIIADKSTYDLSITNTNPKYKKDEFPTKYEEAYTTLDGKNVTSTLTSSNESVVVTDGSTYKVVGFGTATLTASYSDEKATKGEVISKSVTITVKELCSTIKFAIDGEPMITVGESAEIGVTTWPFNVKVEYSSSNVDVATISEDGTITAKMPGTTNIIATAKDDGGHQQQMQLIVLPINNIIDMADVSVSYTRPKLASLIESGKNTDYDHPITGKVYETIVNSFTTTESTDQDVVMLNKDGILTYNGFGESDITVTWNVITLTGERTFTGNMKVTVNRTPYCESLTCENTLSIPYGMSYDLDDFVVTTVPENEPYVFSTTTQGMHIDSNNVLTVDENFMGAGSIKITPTNNTSLAKRITFTTYAIEPIIPNEYITIKVGEVVNLGVTVLEKDTISYQVSDTGIVTVDNIGNVKGLSTGTVTITVTTETGGVGLVQVTVLEDDTTTPSTPITPDVPNNPTPVEPNKPTTPTTPTNPNTPTENENKYEENFVDVKIKNGEAIITEVENEEFVTIPSYIEKNGKRYRVTKIADYAFSGCDEIKEIILPSGIKKIGAYAFSGCKNLKRITLPKNVTEIGAYAFKNCKNLKSITIPKKVKKIGKNAFKGCSKLKTITIKTKKLTSSSKNAMKGVSTKKVTIKVPSSKKKSYKKIWKGYKVK